MPAALGPQVDEEGTTFRLWSTTHARCDVRLFDDAGRAIRTEPMAPVGGRVFEARIAGVGAGARYRLVLDGIEYNDPYARFLPGGIAEPGALVRSTYRWQHDHVLRPLREHAIYELHVGTFTDDGTYAAARRRLPELVELGVTAIELMPVAAFGGSRGWGYDGVAHYAPHAPYGSPDELRAFVDAVHGEGLAVLLDVVYNHFGPAGNVLAEYSPEYFTHDVTTVWGDAPDFRQPWMRRYVLDNVRYWLTEFRIDGLRLDAVHAIVDPSARSILRDIADVAHELVPGSLVIAEDDRRDPAIVTRGGFDAKWDDDFHHAMHVTLTGERDGYYAGFEPGAATVARVISGGSLPVDALVHCIQNHDQVGNRALGERLAALVSPEAYRCAASVLLFLPMTPLVFQGEEWCASTPFLYFTDHDGELGAAISQGRLDEHAHFRAFSDPAVQARIPDPQAVSTFERSKLRWGERGNPPHAETLALYRDLLHLRREDPVLARAGRDALSAEARGHVLVVKRWHGAARRTLIANLSAEPAHFEGRDLPSWGTVLVQEAG